MTIKKKKEKMLKFGDYYGGDLLSLDIIEKAKTNEDLRNCLHRHTKYLEDQNIDALTHLDCFKRELGLY